jgi:hypothetical protein
MSVAFDAFVGVYSDDEIMESVMTVSTKNAKLTIDEIDKERNSHRMHKNQIVGPIDSLVYSFDSGKTEPHQIAELGFFIEEILVFT